MARARRSGSRWVWASTMRTGRSATEDDLPALGAQRAADQWPLVVCLAQRKVGGTEPVGESREVTAHLDPRESLGPRLVVHGQPVGKASRGEPVDEEGESVLDRDVH